MDRGGVGGTWGHTLLLSPAATGNRMSGVPHSSTPDPHATLTQS